MPGFIAKGHADGWRTKDLKGQSEGWSILKTVNKILGAGWTNVCERRCLRQGTEAELALCWDSGQAFTLAFCFSSCSSLSSQFPRFQGIDPEYTPWCVSLSCPLRQKVKGRESTKIREVFHIMKPGSGGTL